MTSKTLYAHWRDVPESAWRWPSFSPAEIACRGTGKLLIDERALDMLQALRDKIGKPLILNSAYRSPEHNRRVGGAVHSKHLEGIAFDVRMDNHEPQDFMAAARAVGFKGIGEYPVLGFCHIDARDTPANWTGSRGKRFPPRTVSDRFAGEVVPTPVKDQAPTAAAAGLGLVAVENTLTDLVEQGGNIFPAEWITYLTVALAVVVVLRIVVPLVLPPQEDEQA